MGAILFCTVSMRHDVCPSGIQGMNFKHMPESVWVDMVLSVS